MNNNNNNNNNETIFELLFNENCIKNDFHKKFDYKIFLTKNHDTYKLRNSVSIQTLNSISSKYQKLGQFYRNENLYWSFYMPRIVKFNIDENIMNNEIFVNFFKNLQKDIGTDNKNDVYVVLANLYESLPQYENTLAFTFYHFLSTTDINNIDIYPTFCRISDKISTNNIVCKKLELSLLSFLVGDQDKYRDKRVYECLINFMLKFEFIIKNKFYNNVIDILNNLHENRENIYIKKTEYNKIKKVIMNLTERCKSDNNPAFLYSNLGKKLYETISKPILENDIATIRLLYIMICTSIKSN